MGVAARRSSQNDTDRSESPRPDRSVAIAALGAMFIASSGVLVRLAASTPVTVAFYRCLYALPILGLLTLREERTLGSLQARSRYLAWLAGAFFALDLVFWHHAIAAVGAGLATVLGNLQVVVVGFAAWLLLKERPQSSLFVAVPVVLAGVVLISGVTGGEAYGRDPAGGVVYGVATSLAYAAFLLILRQGSQDLTRIAGPLFHATLASAVTAAVYGGLAGGMQWLPRWPEHGWLVTLALSAQVAGWLLISRSLPRLPAAVTSVVLLLQPVGAMVLAAVALEEEPGPAQLAGAVMVLFGVVIATRGRSRRSEVAPQPA